MTHEAIDTTWLMEAARGHSEAMLQVKMLPPKLSAPLLARFKSRELAFGSREFFDLRDLIAGYDRDRRFYQEECASLSANVRGEFVAHLDASARLIAEKLHSFRLLLGEN